MSAGDPENLGPFRIVRRLGVGGMGLVYEAVYAKNNKTVALKLLSPDLGADPHLIARFDREMEILKKLKHRNIIRYFGGGVVEGRRFYAMELLPGGSVEDLLKDRGRLSWEQALDFSRQIAQALEHAHNAGVIHRDLKPANLLLTDKNTIKLSDFGIARDQHRNTQLTAAGKTVGTMAYMAPEQITGKHEIGRRTDLYALGCVIYQMLSGHTPFSAETQPELLFKHVEEIPRGIREEAHDCPAALEDLINELLEKEPQDRPFDALAVQVKLDEIRKTASQPIPAGATAAATLATGGATMRRDLEKLQAKKKKKRKKKKDVPLFERTSVLLPLLGVVLGAIAWILWPASEKTLYQEAKVLMATDDPASWKDAQRQFITPMLDRFPDGEHAAEGKAWVERIEMHDAERQVERAMKSGRDPKNESERLYIQARSLEKFGDRLTALKQYRAMEVLLEGRDGAEVYLRLAKQRAADIAGSVDEQDDTLRFIAEQIDKADDLYLDGEKIRAQERWQGIARLYRDNPEFDVQVKRARDRLVDPLATIRSERAAEKSESESAAEKVAEDGASL